jgi:hypothetical protein
MPDARFAQIFRLVLTVLALRLIYQAVTSLLA